MDAMEAWMNLQKSTLWYVGMFPTTSGLVRSQSWMLRGAITARASSLGIKRRKDGRCRVIRSKVPLTPVRMEWYSFRECVLGHWPYARAAVAEGREDGAGFMHL